MKLETMIPIPAGVLRTCSGNAVKVYGAIALEIHRGPTRNCTYASAVDLAAAAGLLRDTFERGQRELVEKGIITRHRDTDLPYAPWVTEFVGRTVLPIANGERP